jgi:hypothetical protein
MRRFTVVQEIPASVDEHWRVFFDDAFERALYLEAMRFPRYELLESRDSGDALHRKIKVVPRLEAPAAVAKLLGSSFGYVEEGTFDKRDRVWRSRVIPSVMADRIRSDFTVTAVEAGEGKCRRTVDVSVEARIFAVGGMVESVFEKSMRDGWRDSAVFMAEWLRRPSPPPA